jgi:hypothetical protein
MTPTRVLAVIGTALLGVALLLAVLPVTGDRFSCGTYAGSRSWPGQDCVEALSTRGVFVWVAAGAGLVVLLLVLVLRAVLNQRTTSSVA